MNIYFALGSNLGDRLQNLRNAVNKLRTIGNITACSDVYASEAWGGVQQPDYLNACVKVETIRDIDPLELLRTIKRFELELGRMPSVRWGARKIDIDILMIDGLIYQTEELNIPHISMCDRLFVLVPLCDILPEEYRHPTNDMTIRDMIRRLEGETLPVRITEL